MEIEEENNISNNNNKVQKQNRNNCPDNQNINEDNSEMYIFDYEGLFQKVNKQKTNEKNKENEYICNIIFFFSQMMNYRKLELIQLLYIFNSNPKDKNYKYYLFKEFYRTLELLKQNEGIYNYNQLIEILLGQGKFFKEIGNIFYSYFFLYNRLYRDIPNIKKLRQTVKNELISLNETNRQNFSSYNTQKYKELFSILKAIYNNTLNINNNDISYVINYIWIIRAAKFIQHILNSSNTNERESRLKDSFYLYEVYNYYFGEEGEKTLNPFPGMIDNYQISDFNDIWEDPQNIDENYMIKDNLTYKKDYHLVNEKFWNILKEHFGATNEIKRKKNNLDMYKITVIILDKRIFESKSYNILKPKIIQTKKNITINEFKEKIIRCLNYAFKNKEIKHDINDNEENFENIDEKDTFDKDINMNNMSNDKDNFQLENINVYQNIDIKINNIKEDEVLFYTIEKDKKELLIEIFSAFLNGLPVYESIYINNLVLNNESPLERIFDKYNELKDVLIIELKRKNDHSFLSKKESNENCFYQCSTCKNFEPLDKKYNCPRCNYSFFCSKKCSSSDNLHMQLHECLKALQIKDNNNSSKYNNFNLVGLINLGNTCFINSVLQCLLYTSDLSKYFLQNKYKKEINNENNHGFKGEIAESFADLFKRMKSADTQRINPINFLRVFFTKNRSLSVSHQQDAQEFLSILLDSLHEDLNRITKKPYVLLEEQKDTESDSEASNRFWDVYKKRENSIIVDLFHGQFKSKITCSDCHKSSITYDPFIFLGLPIPQHHNQIIIPFFFGEKWEIFGFELKKDSTINDLKNNAVDYMRMYGYKINESFDILYNSIELVQCDENKIIKNIYNECNKLDDNELLSTILNKDKSLNIVLYEKKVDKDYFNIYAYPIKGEDYNSSSYPLVLSVNAKMNFKSIIEENRQKILNIYANSSGDENIKIGLLHKKNNGWIYYFTNIFDSREFCPGCQNSYENYCIFNNNLIIGTILQKMKNYNPVLFVIGCINKVINHNIMQIPDKINNGFFCLDECLKLFCEEELLNNDNMWYCNKCKKHRTAKKQIRLFKLPLYLIIQLKKFKNSSNFFYSSNEKKDTFIKYPINDLDLNKYVEDQNGNIQKYNLYAVIQHHGEISQGHYTAICKINGIWVLFNDSIISKISSPITNDAYLLFYRRNETQ